LAAELKQFKASGIMLKNYKLHYSSIKQATLGHRHPFHLTIQVYAYAWPFFTVRQKSSESSKITEAKV
jgi:hypothetical protein